MWSNYSIKQNEGSIMKKKRLRLTGFVAIVMTGLLMTGCGSSYKESAAETAAAGSAYVSDNIYEYKNTMEVAEESAAEEMAYEGDSAAQTPEVQDTQRKLIRNVNLEVETETFDELLVTVEAKIAGLGGYIEESYIYNGSSYYGRSGRNSNMTIRIPADKLDDFLSEVSEVSNVISRNESVTDVTLQYVDMESHKKVLLAEQERLLELLERAETIEDIITLESRLSDVRYQIESMESQLRTMDNQVTYSTVYLFISEVTRLTPVNEQSVWEKITTGFADSLVNVGNGIVDLAIGFVINLPYLVVWAAVVAVLVILIRLIIRKKRQKKQRKEEKVKEEEKKKGENDEQPV